ncbi:MAG: hypothetical protein KDI20_13970, partial [Pseudomonadales bacterium]|nr:hypothetical protein [Pseudomonadales bacterium]
KVIIQNECHTASQSGISFESRFTNHQIPLRKFPLVNQTFRVTAKTSVLFPTQGLLHELIGITGKHGIKCSVVDLRW